MADYYQTAISKNGKNVRRFTNDALASNELVPRWLTEYDSIEGNTANDIKRRNQIAARIRSYYNVRRYLQQTGKNEAPYRYVRGEITPQQRERMNQRRLAVNQMKRFSLSGLTREQALNGAGFEEDIRKLLKPNQRWSRFQRATKAADENAPFYYSNGALTGGPKPIAIVQGENALIPFVENIGQRPLNKALATYFNPLASPPTRKILYRVGEYRVIATPEAQAQAQQQEYMF